jgi:hypothetical protein
LVASLGRNTCRCCCCCYFFSVSFDLQPCLGVSYFICWVSRLDTTTNCSLAAASSSS